MVRRWRKQTKLANRQSLCERTLADVRDWCVVQQIPHCCAPVEADWQLVQVEKQGMCDAILTDDFDIHVLGGQLVTSRLVCQGRDAGKCDLTALERLVREQVPA